MQIIKRTIKTLAPPPGFKVVNRPRVGPILLPICSDIDADYAIDCDNLLLAGVKDRLILGNYADITGTTIVANVLEDMTLANPAVSYEGMNNSHQPSVKMVRKTYAPYYDHVIKFLIFNCTQAIKTQIEKMGKAKLFAVIENNQPNATGNNAFEVFGLGQGLTLLDLERDYNNDENQGAYVLTLGTPEKSKETKLPITWFKTDYGVTKGRVDAILV